MTRRWRVRPADRPAGRQMPPKGADEVSFVSCPARRQCPPNTTAASAATYPLRCFAPQWARFDNRHPVEANTPTVAGQAVAEASAPVNAGTVLLTDSDDHRTPPASAYRQICTCPPRAKGSLDRRSKWFSLVPFFLQKKKGTRAGARNTPACARRRNTDSPPQRRNPPRAKGP